MPTDWTSLAYKIAEIGGRFPDRFSARIVGHLQHPDAISEFLMDADSENATEIEAAVKRCAEGFPWPELTEVQQLLLRERTEHALLFLNSLGCRMDVYPMTERPAPTPEPLLLQWLLVTVWKQHREHWMALAGRKLIGQA